MNDMTQQQFNSLFFQAKKMMLTTKDINHNWAHLERVAANALKIKSLLSADSQSRTDDKILILAAVWHDISYAFCRAGFIQYLLEGRRSRKIVNQYFQAANLDPQEAKLIADIIVHHTFNNFGATNRKRSFYHQIIQDADTFEMLNKERLKTATAAAKHSFYWFVAIKILKPVFFVFFLRFKSYFLNLKESAEIF